METDKDNFKYANLSLKKNINNTKQLYFEEKIAWNKNNLKGIWRILRSLAIPSKGGKCKISLKENGVVSFDPKRNANIFCRFFSNLRDSLLLKPPLQKTNLESNYYRVL